jgi:hypothetical protein
MPVGPRTLLFCVGFFLSQYLLDLGIAFCRREACKPLDLRMRDMSVGSEVKW